MQQYAIKELRRLLLNEADFERTKDYFFNWVHEHSKIALATRTKNKNIIKIVNLGLSDYFKKGIIIENARMYEVKNLNFVHGSGSFLRSGQSVFFYFSDLDWGMIIGLMPDDSVISRFRLLVEGPLGFSTEGREN